MSAPAPAPGRRGRAALQRCQEHNIALVEVAKIAGYRFDRLVADANPIASARARPNL